MLLENQPSLVAFGPGITADQILETLRTKTSTRPLAEISNSVQQRNKSCGQWYRSFAEIFCTNFSEIRRCQIA